MSHAPQRIRQQSQIPGRFSRLGEDLVGGNGHSPDAGPAHHQNHAPPRANHPSAFGEYLPHFTEVAVDDSGSLPVAPQPTHELVDSRLSRLGERLARRRLHERGALVADVAVAERTVSVRADAQYIGHPRDRDP
jgi:hypothetical protein